MIDQVEHRLLFLAPFIVGRFQQDAPPFPFHEAHCGYGSVVLPHTKDPALCTLNTCFQ
jgi:hypothetical protein